jgi:hypothetical protein
MGGGRFWEGGGGQKEFESPNGPAEETGRDTGKGDKPQRDNVPLAGPSALQTQIHVRLAVTALIRAAEDIKKKSQS